MSHPSLFFLGLFLFLWSLLFLIWSWNSMSFLWINNYFQRSHSIHPNLFNWCHNSHLVSIRLHRRVLASAAVFMPPPSCVPLVNSLHKWWLFCFCDLKIYAFRVLNTPDLYTSFLVYFIFLMINDIFLNSFSIFQLWQSEKSEQ